MAAYLYAIAEQDTADCPLPIADRRVLCLIIGILPGSAPLSQPHSAEEPDDLSYTTLGP